MSRVLQFKAPEQETQQEPPQRVKLHDGKLTLYKRPEVKNANVWHYAIKTTAGGYERKTTGTTDLDKATAIATKAYLNIEWRVERGLSVTAVTFKQASDAYLKELERLRTTTPGKHVNNQKVARKLRKIIQPYFENMRLVDIRQKHITEFHTDYLDHWREAGGAGFGPRQPSAFSNRQAESAIRGVFDHAVAIGMITNAERPTIARTKVHRVVRGDFKPHEEAAIFAKLQADMVDPELNARQARARALIYWYCRWLRVTGMRPGVEVLSILISEIEYRSDRDPPDVVLHVRDGKLGARQVVVRQDEVVEIIDAVKALHRQPITSTSRLFNMDVNKKPDWFGMHFHKILLQLGLQVDASGAPRSLYSFRHTCITDWINRGRTLGWVAANCGTSIEMIANTYAHVIHTQQSSELKK